jgi:Winged helix-turn helix
MVRELIGREFAVRLSEVSVGRRLGRLGRSPQRPRDRADRQDPEAVARWKAETPPAASGGRRGGGQELRRRRGRGALGRSRGHDLGAGGQTPVVAAPGDRFGSNLIAAVAAKGALRFAADEGRWHGSVVIDCCRRLLADGPGPVVLVLMVIRCIAPRPSRRSRRRPTGGCGGASCPGRRRN